ncbi:alpha/beta hydrolase [Amycolatopsis pithecellobii]|uniref:Acyl-CoA:diacylglycerol acyltransferase n=1 Tax=Amycolatopsis pithecellobii TaxID=664692 RepID=A0A6N7Z5I9_9PSEU|nr:alpha/beta hydrolase-fold protein [Amycolatopsis pithecellobii]MTD56909.1 alpha/beta hydrolase [Amycolatopsis pithecellobii]
MDRLRISRRTLLVAGGAGLGVAAFAAATELGAMTADPPVQRALGATPSTSANPLGAARVERVWSDARGREVDLVTLLPARAPADGLPMVLALHGLHGRARTAAPTGTLTTLTDQVARHASPAFGLVAVDGGDSYWHQHTPGDDPMRMLLEEVPQWLRQRSLGGADGLPFAVMGMSMGGFGALLYARRRAERRLPVRALALLAPALILSWQEMAKRQAFRDATDWASMDPLKHLTAAGNVATGVWCGTEDPFIQGVRQFIAATHPSVAYTAHGPHGDSFNRTVVPGVLGFLGRYVA